MTKPTESYEKVHYELRPAKQVERRMLVDAFQALASGGFPIRDYQYTGMGSVYFIDFMLFHRLLGMSDMLSVEFNAKIAKRIEFNRPFNCVRTKLAPIGEVIPTLSPNKKHLLWLDYDDILTSGCLEDISLAATYLSVGSILLVTVDLQPPTADDDPKQWRNYFTDQARRYLKPTLTVRDFAKSKLPRRNIDIIAAAIKAGFVGRTDLEFMPMFNFLYQDGHQMLTMGGMFGAADEKRKVQAALDGPRYYRNSFDSEPCKIKVPRLTRKERQYLDGFMPCADEWEPEAFEMSAENIKAYRDIYRFCPTYAELLL